MLELTRKSQDDINELGARLAAALPNAKALVEACSVSLPDSGESAYRALMSLTVARLRDRRETPEAAALRVAELLSEESERGTADLTPLLAASSLIQHAKVLDLEGAVPSILHAARLLTDIRPLFDDDPSRTITQALISCTLEVDFTRYGHYEELFLALDRNDLMSLKDQVERALIKFDTAVRFINAAGAESLTIDGDLK